jgi:hypothetical protein
MKTAIACGIESILASFPVTNAILEQRATTPEGLKIQARAIALAVPDLWDFGGRHDTYEKAFIESACSFFGMDAKSIAMGMEAKIITAIS